MPSYILAFAILASSSASDPGEARSSLRFLEGHKDEVYAVAVHSESELIASCGRDKSVRIWSAKSNKELAVLEGHSDFVNSVSFDKSGKWLFSGGRDKTVRVWDVENGKLKLTLNAHAARVMRVVSAGDGRLASCAEEKDIILWDIKSEKPGMLLTGHDKIVASIAASPDGKSLASSGRDGTIRIWNLQNGKTVAKRVFESGNCLEVFAFDSSGKLLIAKTDSDSVSVLDAETLQSRTTLQTKMSYVFSAAISHDGRILTCSGWGTIKFWDLATKKEIHSFEDDDINAIWCVAFGPDGKSLISGGSDRIVKSRPLPFLR